MVAECDEWLSPAAYAFRHVALCGVLLLRQAIQNFSFPVSCSHKFQMRLGRVPVASVPNVEPSPCQLLTKKLKLVVTAFPQEFYFLSPLYALLEDCCPQVQTSLVLALCTSLAVTANSKLDLRFEQ